MTLNFISVFVAFFHVSYSSEEPHPYGESKKILSIIDINGTKEFITETTTIEEIFLHPDVKGRKIVVLSIIGAYRKGKSFFLDYCLRFLYANYRSINNFNESKPIAGDWMGDGNATLQGFSWRHGSTADTKGMKMWSDVFLHDTPTEKIAIVVMDTQGLFETGSTREENGRIFGLSTLISSIQILNIKNELQEDQLEYLETATSLAKIIAKKQKSTEWKPFQRLLFLFRDWSDYEVGYGYEGGKKYLKTAILKVAGKQNSKANVIRQNIRSSFDDISCFLLNNPGLEITKGHGEWSTLDKDFVTKLKIVIESLLSPDKLIKKSTLGKDLTAKEFQALIVIYFNAFANASLPDTENILQLAINNQMQTIVNTQLKVFNQLQTDLKIDFDRENFIEWVAEVHKINTNKTIDGFLKAEKLEDEESSMKFEKTLKAEVVIAFDNWNKTNMKIYEGFQEQKREREIKDGINLQLKTYQEIMSNNLDFNQDDFEKYYEVLHKTAFANAVQELEKMKFKDEASKIISVASLKDTLNEKFGNLKTSKVAEYNQHLKFVSILADSQFDAYKININSNLEYENQTDFETYLNEKHLGAKNSSIDKFENSDLPFTPRKAQFLGELVSKMNSEFLKWKEAVKKIYKELQDKNLQTEVDKFIHLQVKTYQKTMTQSTDIDFNQDDFEKYYEDLHKLKFANATEELKKLKFKDEKSKKDALKSLEEKLNSIHALLKGSKIAEFNQHLRAVSSLVEAQFNAYKNILNLNIDYEKPTNFETYINEKEANAKNAAIEGFSNAHLPFSPKKTQFKQELIAKIGSESLTWKDATMKTYKVKQNVLLKETLKLKSDVYNSSLDLDINFEREDFLDFLNLRHKKEKAILIQEFLAETDELENVIAQSKFKSQLSIDIDEVFKPWFEDKKEEYKNFVENRKIEDENTVKTSYDNKIKQFDENMEEFKNFMLIDYESLMTTKFSDQKEIALGQFKNETKNVFDRESVEYKIIKLTNYIDDFKDSKLKTYRELRTTGIWVSWSGSKNGVPKYAVVGGYDGGDLYFARAEIRGGKHVGSFKANYPNAYFPYEGKVSTLSTFEIFTHTNYKFVSDESAYNMIIGGYANGNTVYMCRSQYNFYGKQEEIPGKLIDRTCYVEIDGKEDDFGSFYHQYDVLVLN